MVDRLQLQKDEFDTLEALSKAFAQLPAIVDDDYPEMRHYYESRLASFLTALCRNRSHQIRRELDASSGSRPC